MEAVTVIGYARWPDIGRDGRVRRQLDALAEQHSAEVLETALMGVLWGIATNPHRYERVTGYIYQARSRAFDPLHPCFKVLFSIEDENRVLLLWIEEVGSINEIAP